MWLSSCGCAMPRVCVLIRVPVCHCQFDVLAIYAPNHVQYAVCFHAVIALGGVVAPCPASEPKEAIARHMATTRPRVIVTTSAMLSTLVGQQRLWWG